MNEPPPPEPPPWSTPPLAWSESRARHFRECKRRYYLRVYLQHLGWRRSASPLSHLVWTLGRLTTVPLAIGVAIHAAAAACVRACATGRPLPSADYVRAFCASQLNAAVRRSRQGVDAFLRDPGGRPPVLEEYFYGTPPFTAATIKRYRERLDALAANLVGAHEIWDSLRRSAPSDVVTLEPFYAFRIEATAALIYAAPDLVYREVEGERWTILDWKSGAHDGAIDQLCTYGVALADSLRLPGDTGQYSGRVIALGEAADHEVSISPDDLEDARRRIRDDVGRMAALIPAGNSHQPPSPQRFPRTSDTRLCTHCCYRGLCFPELLPPAAASILGCSGELLLEDAGPVLGSAS